MTSDCFVYLMPPGATEFVTVGRFALIEDRHGERLGKFVYGRSYLERTDAVALDPTELPLSATQTFETSRMGGLFGALRDASPDHWGRRVIERHSGLAQLGEIDYLLQSPDDRAGAIGFGLNREPPPPRRQFNRTMHLARLIELVDELVADEEPEQPATEAELAQAQDLIQLGTSMGGARPKAVIEDDGQLWIAKFNRTDDAWNHARVEHAMLELARECRISVAESRVITIAGRDVLLVKRFDRAPTAAGYTRARLLSGLTLLHAEDTHRNRERWSYALLVEELRRISERPRNDAHELFTRMVFNALISNTDDHPRNHAVIAPELDWHLSPAYDLTPSPEISNERRDLALTVGDYGRYANAVNALSRCARFLLDVEEASRIIDDCEAVVRDRWYAVARAAGVTEADCGRIARSFVYDGFRLPAPAS